MYSQEAQKTATTSQVSTSLLMLIKLMEEAAEREGETTQNCY